MPGQRDPDCDRCMCKSLLLGRIHEVMMSSKLVAIILIIRGGLFSFLLIGQGRAYWRTHQAS